MMGRALVSGKKRYKKVIDDADSVGKEDVEDVFRRSGVQFLYDPLKKQSLMKLR